MSEFHVPVMLDESVAALMDNADGIYVDVTFGGGGHSHEILNRLSAKGRLVVFDQDDEAKENEIVDDRITFIPSNFRYMYRYWKWLGMEKVDGILADLGVSSHQFDVDYRGFSYRFDSDLDMRMNVESEKTAADVLRSYHVEELQDVFSKYGEVRNSKKLSNVIESERKKRGIVTTSQLNEILEDIFVGDRNKYFAQVYQALRIEVNEEMRSLGEMLEGSLRILKPGGRIVAISYHSLEDRMVKRFFRSGKLDGNIPKDDFGRSISKMKAAGKMLLPSKKEQENNPRSKSAKMRVGVRI